MKASRGSSRGRNADSTRPGGRTVGMSFDECTARSIAPAASASSISLVNRPFPPTSASGRSWMASPVVRMILISMRSASSPPAAASRRCTSRACASASGEPREPMRKSSVAAEDCAMGPCNARPDSHVETAHNSRICRVLHPRARDHRGGAHWNLDGHSRHRNHLRRDGRGPGQTDRGRPRPHPVQHRAVAGQRARRVRRRGAGDRGARPRRGARPHHRQVHGRGAVFLRIGRRHCGGSRAWVDRRSHRRAHDREGDRAGAREAARRRQPPRSARADGPAHRRHAVPLLPVPRLRRPHPDRRRARRRRLSAARHHGRRRHRRSLRQDRKTPWPRLSGRPAGGEGGHHRRCRTLRFAAADGRASRRQFLAVRSQDRAAARGGERSRRCPTRMLPTFAPRSSRPWSMSSPTGCASA